MWKILSTLINRAAAPPKVMSNAPVAPVSDNQAVTCDSLSEDAIRPLAYMKWEAAGKPEGDDLRFWLEAKREASQKRRPKPR
jgi:hypothetical protein